MMFLTSHNSVHNSWFICILSSKVNNKIFHRIFLMHSIDLYTEYTNFLKYRMYLLKFLKILCINSRMNILCIHLQIYILKVRLSIYFSIYYNLCHKFITKLDLAKPFYQEKIVWIQIMMQRLRIFIPKGFL